jgi:iron complex outermembrane receptor protein
MKTMLKKLLFFMLVLPLSVLAQNTVKGKVTDGTSNQAMPGVSVVITGTTNGTFTDSDGTFTLKNVKSGDNVSFSFLGFKTETIAYTNQQSLSVSLQQDGQGIEEVVVVGYGKVKKKDATGAVTQISAKDFNRGATPTVENLLNGRVAGLQINTGGGPASGSAIRIRGGASITAANDPLIVVDGLPISNDSPSGSRNFLATLDPNTVESMSVLKDASATAIYGSRASNGVIIITTKKGGKKLKVDYNFQYGSGKHYRKIDVLSSEEFVNKVAQLYPDQMGSLGVSSGIADDPTTPGINESRTIYNTDWQEEIFRRTDYVTNNLNVSGSLFDKIPARLSVGNTYQEGLILTDRFNRNTAGLNLSPSLFKNHLKLTLNANVSNEKNNFARTPIGSAIRFDPTKPVYDTNSQWGGFYEYTGTNGNLTPLAPRNPVAEILQSTSASKVNRILGNFQLDYKFHFLPELRAVVNLGYDQSRGEGNPTLARNSAVSDGNGGNALTDKFGESSSYYSSFTNRLLDGYFVYNKKFGKLDFEGTAGYSYQKFVEERFNTGNVLNTTNDFSDLDRTTDRVLIGYFARTNLTYNDKYLLTLTYRRDGTSVFAKENQFGNFPAASFAWKLNNEFFKNSSTISDLKLRAGWGITGQQDLGRGRRDYYQSQYTTGFPGSQYVFGNLPINVGLPRDYNPNLKWEETTTYNVGLDYGLFNDRITGSVEAYYKLSDDLLFDAPFADGSNFSNSGPQNIGSLDIKGVEFTLNADIIRKEKFSWNVNFNATKFERRIKDLKTVNNTPTGGIGGGTGGNIQVFSEGWTPNSFYVFKQLYGTDGMPIEGAFADLNGDNIINDNDKYIYKNTDPDLLLGFQSTMNVYNFDFSFNLRASIGNRMYNNVNSGNAYTDNMFANSILSNVPTSTFDSNFSNSGNNVIFSDYFIEDASFLRMDNVTLGYTFENWLEGKASVRLSAGVQNAFVITKYSGLDPEVFSGIDNTIYPRQRQFLFGVNMKF